jgi:hypothetical protein
MNRLRGILVFLTVLLVLAGCSLKTDLVPDRLGDSKPIIGTGTDVDNPSLRQLPSGLNLFRDSLDGSSQRLKRILDCYDNTQSRPQFIAIAGLLPNPYQDTILFHYDNVNVWRDENRRPHIDVDASNRFANLLYYNWVVPTGIGFAPREMFGLTGQGMVRGISWTAPFYNIDQYLFYDSKDAAPFVGLAGSNLTQLTDVTIVGSPGKGQNFWGMNCYEYVPFGSTVLPSTLVQGVFAIEPRELDWSREKPLLGDLKSEE